MLINTVPSINAATVSSLSNFWTHRELHGDDMALHVGSHQYMGSPHSQIQHTGLGQHAPADRLCWIRLADQPCKEVLDHELAPCDSSACGAGEIKQHYARHLPHPNGKRLAFWFEKWKKILILIINTENHSILLIFLCTQANCKFFLLQTGNDIILGMRFFFPAPHATCTGCGRPVQQSVLIKDQVSQPSLNTTQSHPYSPFLFSLFHNS